MFFNKFFYFTKKYVIIEIEGRNTENFLNACVSHKIRFLNSISLKNGNASVAITVKDFEKLSPIADNTDCTITVISKHTPRNFLKTHKDTLVFILGLLILPCALLITSHFVWTVEINGAKYTDTDQLYKLLKDNGIYKGARKSKLMMPLECKELIINNTPNITWAWMYIEGTKLRIEIHEGRIPPKIINKDTPCDIVASRDGIIQKIYCRSGTPLVSAGQVVCKGDILIAGTMDKSQFGIYTIHSSGDVYAQTIHYKSGYYPAFVNNHIKTNNNCGKLTINLFSLNIPLYIRNKPPFDCYVSKTEKYEAKFGKNYHLGFGITRDIFYETTIKKDNLKNNIIEEYARMDLEKQICNEFVGEALKNTEDFRISQSTNDTFFAELTMNCTENISQIIPIEKIKNDLDFNNNE